jgi:predicted PurR-regulated permease PerM
VRFGFAVISFAPVLVRFIGIPSCNASIQWAFQGEHSMRFDRLMEQLIGVLALLVLAGGTLIVIAPFVTALLWGAILAYCTWRPYQRLKAAFGGRRVWAALLIALLILGTVLGPMLYAGFAFSAHVPQLVDMLHNRLAAGLPPFPEWLLRLPLVGPRVEDAWSGIVARNPEVVARLRELAGPVLRTALGAGLAVAQGLGLLALSILFAAYFYLSGESAAQGLRASMVRVAGARGDYLLGLIGGTVKGVVYGILGTSLAQAVLCAFGYWIAGLPSPAMLGLATFFLAIIPGGPLLVAVPGALWLTQHGQATWAVFLIVWLVVIGITVDSVLKPMLIGRGSHVPFILIMLGVLGGAAAFGLLGVFIGPTLLAVAHAVLRDWTTGVAVQERAEESIAVPRARPAI